MEIGKKLGPYEIVAPIGKGGMGEVFLAQDTKLGRPVAVKVLPATLVQDPERIARFEREARLLASLNHPNIAGVYGFDESDGTRFLVMEYVEGQTLSQRLDAGPLPVEEALDVGRQTAKALEEAHERGIIHRDLKPGNIMLTSEGKVKVLDFGLAKAMAEDSSMASDANSPTITADYTKPGVILGTAAYMSPEQARGRKVDKRTDVWSFGVILFECLTGQTLFRGETATDSMGAIMHREPDWSALPPSTPPAVRRVLRRCLAKDRTQRMRDVGDVRIELEEAGPSADAIAETATERHGRLTPLPWILVVLMAIVMSVAVFTRPESEKNQGPVVARSRHLELNLSNAIVPLLSKPLAVSPDGTAIAWIAGSQNARHIRVGRLDGSPPTAIPESAGASMLFFSPKGDWLGFFAGQPDEAFSSLYELKKVKLDGSHPVVLGQSTLPGFASWSTDGRIYFSDRLSKVLAWVPESGGEVRRLESETAPDSKPPYFIDAPPESRSLLVTSLNHFFSVPTEGDAQPHSISSGRAGGAIGALWDAGRVRYLPTGHIAYSQRGRLMAAPFDLDSLSLLAPPIPVLDGVRSSIYHETWDVSADGLLAFMQGDAEFEGELVWADAEGTLTPLPFDPGYLGTFKISPDGHKIALGVLDVKWDIWILDLQRESRYRLTTQGDNRWPIWSPDGTEVIFHSQRAGEAGIYTKRADGAGKATRLNTGVVGLPISCSPDGRLLGLSKLNSAESGNDDIFLVSLEGDSTSQPFAQGPTSEWGSMFSPDGKLIAYTSDETGEWSVYLQPYPADGRRWTVSTTSFGEEGIWSRDGKTLYYRSFDRIIAVDVESGDDGSLRIGKQREALMGDFNNAWGISYDVAPDGRLLVVRPVGRRPSDRVSIITNWFEELERKVPTGGSARRAQGATE